MKFLTLDCYNSWYGDYEDSSRLYAAYQQYHRHLEAMEGILPAEALELAKLQGTDDGLVVEVRHDREQNILTLTLRCGHLQMGYYDLILRYEDAEISAEDEKKLARIARTTVNDSRHESDLCFQEVDVTEGGRIEHRLLFHYGVWFAIRCCALHWEKVDRPNRDLPRLKDRFPGGPSMPPAQT